MQTEPRYLAKCVYLMNAEQMESFLETTILTLYAFTPREEFLILKLFRLAIQHEMSIIKHLSDFLGGDSVVPKMVITYNRRKQGLEYLKKTLSPLLLNLVEKSDLNLELHPLNIYQANPDVRRIMDGRLRELETICQSFLDGILRTMEDLPYRMRWICKQLRDLTQNSLHRNSSSR